MEPQLPTTQKTTEMTEEEQAPADVPAVDAESAPKGEAVSLTEEQAEFKTELEDLPIHALHTRLEKQGIFAKSTDSRENLVKMLVTGKSIHAAPGKAERKRVMYLPPEIMPELERMKAERGLQWTENAEEGTVTFKKDLTVTTTMDQTAAPILAAAKSAFAAGRPPEINHERDIAWS